MIEIKRDFCLKQLKEKQGNGLVKIITGIRRFGKSYLLLNYIENTCFKMELRKNKL